MTIRRTGYGAGQRQLPGQPNVLRAVLGEAAAAPSTAASSCSSATSTT